MADPLTKIQLKALVKAFDKPMATRQALGISPTVAAKLVERGLLQITLKRPLTFVGTTIKLYSITWPGEQEVYWSGERRKR